MKLIIFDIDGTILDSVQADDSCFIQTFQHLHKIDLNDSDWNDFTNATDTGLTMEIFEKWFNRQPKKEEIESIKSYFENLLKDHCTHFTEIENALSFIELASTQSDLEVAFATGGWQETALLKCNSVGLNLHNYIFKTSNDHFNRAKILQFVIEEALTKNGLKKFETITYFGDGLWDLKTTQNIGVDFIGVDAKKTGKLQEAGADKVITNFVDTENIFKWLNQKRQ